MVRHLLHRRRHLGGHQRAVQGPVPQAHAAPSLLLAMDLPTQVGLDSDDELAVGEVGRIGVAVSSLDGHALGLFDGLGLDRVISGTVGNSIGVYTCPLFERGRARGRRTARMTMRIVAPERPAEGVHRPRHADLPGRDRADAVDRRRRIRSPQARDRPGSRSTRAARRCAGAASAPRRRSGFGLSNMLTYVDGGAAAGDLAGGRTWRAPTCTCPPTRTCSPRSRSSAQPGEPGRSCWRNATGAKWPTRARSRSRSSRRATG